MTNITANKELVKQMRIVGKRNEEAEKISFTLGLAMQRKPNDRPFQKSLFDLLREHIQGTVTMVDEIEREALLISIGEGSWGAE